MKNKIGFAFETAEPEVSPSIPQPRTIAPRKSLVRIRFPGQGAALTYYNDLFDLQVGDFVYVDGKLEGQRGRVTEVNYNFKIKLSDYKRVIALVDTSVKGQLHFAGSHFVTFDRHALPAQKAALWFRPPVEKDEEFVTGSDDTAFLLDDLKGMKVSQKVAERGHEYYMQNKVVYLCLDGTRGYAIVDGSEAYEVEFEYRNGEISHLICSCFCSYNCKHQFAVMLQLKELLAAIEQNYAAQFTRSEYFAAMPKEILFSFAIDGRQTGSFTME